MYFWNPLISNVSLSVLCFLCMFVMTLNLFLTTFTAWQGHKTGQNRVTGFQPLLRNIVCCCLVLIIDWPSCSFSEAPLFFIFLGVFMKSGKMVLKPRMSTNLWQLSAPSGPIIPWSRTFRALVRDIFFSLQKREETMLKLEILMLFQ